jgi:luciferase family oxidoreductase group 1
MSDQNDVTRVTSDTIDVELSLLDETVIWNGSSASQVFKEARDMAVSAEQLGYKRYWFSESHNTTDHASSSPELLLAHIAAFTSQIKLGTSNLMLPNQSALKVVENFRTLQGVYPGRIDLGFVLSTGNDLLVAQALHRTHDLVSETEYPEQLADLLAFLTDSYSTSGGKIMASPNISTMTGVWVQGSDHGAQYATEYGLGLVVEHQSAPHITADVLRAYRKFFKPSVFLAEPHSILIVPVLCAESDEEAELWAKPLDLWEIRKEQGIHLPPPSLKEANDYVFTLKEEEIRAARRAGSIIGNVSNVGSKLRKLAEETSANEIMILTSHPDKHIRLKTIQLLAKEFRLTSVQTEGGSNNG